MSERKLNKLLNKARETGTLEDEKAYILAAHRLDQGSPELYLKYLQRDPRDTEITEFLRPYLPQDLKKLKTEHLQSIYILNEDIKQFGLEVRLVGSAVKYDSEHIKPWSYRDIDIMVFGNEEQEHALIQSLYVGGEPFNINEIGTYSFNEVEINNRIGSGRKMWLQLNRRFNLYVHNRECYYTDVDLLFPTGPQRTLEYVDAIPLTQRMGVPLGGY